MPHTALLLFSKTASAEARDKTLINRSRNSNFLAIDALIKRAHNIARQSALPLFIHSEKDQRGLTFGEKLHSSVKYVFDQGFEKVIVIGNDCPRLSLSHIHNAVYQLETHDHVLAPTKKGGIYLAGYCRSSFAPHYNDIRWQSEFAYHDLCASAQQRKITVYHLLYLDHIKKAKDHLQDFYHLPVVDTFKLFIQSILSSIYNLYSASSVFFKLRDACVIVLRGPPVIF